MNLSLGPRVGFTVGRVLGPSVVRNRIRRRMREAVRLNLDRLHSPVDVVINPKKIVLKAEFPRLLEEIERAFAAVEKRLSSPHAASVRDGSRPAARTARKHGGMPRSGEGGRGPGRSAGNSQGKSR